MPSQQNFSFSSSTPAAPAGYRNTRPQLGGSDPALISNYFENVGGVDARSTTTESIAIASMGMLVKFNNASAVAVTLQSSGLPTNFNCAVLNAGAGTATLTPSSGTINGSASFALAQNVGGVLFFDGTNWWLNVGPAAAAATPLVESGSGAIGTSSKYAREDHVHPAAPGSTASDDTTLGGASPSHSVPPTQNAVQQYVAAKIAVNPAIRGSSIIDQTSSSQTLNFPTGTQAGDLAILIVCAAYSITTPSGWTAASSNVASGTAWDSCVFSKVLTSGDISTGSVTVSEANSWDVVASLVVMVGGTGGIREVDVVRQGGLSGTTFNVSTSSAVQASDTAIYCAADRMGSGTPATPYCNRGTQLGSNVSGSNPTVGALYYENMSTSGVQTIVFQNINTMNIAVGYIIVVEGLPASGQVASGSAGQIAYYPSGGTSIAGTSAIPNGTTATTQSSGDNSTKVATTAYVDGAVVASGIPSQTGNSGKFLTTNGTSTSWGTPSGGSGGSGALVLLEPHTASNSASLDFTTCISSAYDEYEIHILDLLPATDSVAVWFRVSTDGSTYLTSGYGWALSVYDASGNGQTGSSSDSKIVIQNQQSNVVPMNLTLRFTNPGGSQAYKRLHGNGNAPAAGTSDVVRGIILNGHYNSTTSLVAFRVLMSSGNIASGTVRVYGVAKS